MLYMFSAFSYTSAHDDPFTSKWSIHRSLPPNHAELYMDKLGERIKTRAVFHHVKLCCGPSTRWLPLFFMEQPRYWKNILTGEDLSHMWPNTCQRGMVYIYIYIHTHFFPVLRCLKVHTCIHTCTHIHIRRCTTLHVHMHALIHALLHTCIRTHAHMHTRWRMC